MPLQSYIRGTQTAETGIHTVHNVAARSPDVIPPRADALCSGRMSQLDPAGGASLAQASCPARRRLRRAPTSEITRCGLRETRRYAPKCRTRSKPRRLAHVRAISSISLFIARAPFGFPDAVVAHMLGVEIIDITMIAGDDY